ncbi:MAG TPA: hypothetical protein VIL74_14135 [Pyrinomonadaceae bacterium]
MAKVAAEKETGVSAIAYGNKHSFTNLGAMEIERREPRTQNVALDILYCGVCHSDLHQASKDWGNTSPVRRRKKRRCGVFRREGRDDYLKRQEIAKKIHFSGKLNF